MLVDHFVTTKGLNLGRLGVEMFFVLSGRLMADILFFQKLDLPTFFIRRVSRIYPALMLFSGVVLLTSMLIPKLVSATSIQLLSAATLTYNYAQLHYGRSVSLDNIWSLCIEEHMYILLAVVAIATKRKASSALMLISGLAALAIANGVRLTIMGEDYYSVYWRSDVRGASILLGAAAFIISNMRWFQKLKFGAVTWSVGATLAIALNAYPIPDPMKYSIGTAALAIIACNLPISPKPILRTLDLPTLQKVGRSSYSLYLFQQIFFAISFSHLIKLLSIVPAVISGILICDKFETPVRRWLNTKWEARHVPPA